MTESVYADFQKWNRDGGKPHNVNFLLYNRNYEENRDMKELFFKKIIDNISAFKKGQETLFFKY